jgi:hypothetical protein
MLQVACISAGDSQEVFSFSFGGSTDNLLAAGCKSQVQCLYYEINHVEHGQMLVFFGLDHYLLVLVFLLGLKVIYSCTYIGCI